MVHILIVVRRRDEEGLGVGWLIVVYVDVGYVARHVDVLVYWRRTGYG